MQYRTFEDVRYFLWYINLSVRTILIKTWIAGVEILRIEPIGISKKRGIVLTVVQSLLIYIRSSIYSNISYLHSKKSTVVLILILKYVIIVKRTIFLSWK